MPIPVQRIVDQMKSSLDSEGSDRYLFDQDFKPAINFAIDLSVAVFNEAFAENKLSPEQLRELTKVKVWQASGYSRIAYNEVDTGHPLWTIVAVFPNITVNKSAISGASGDNKSVSKFRGDVSFIKSGKDAKRLTFEQWNENDDNAFMPGNVVLTGGLQEYAYLDFADYSSTSYTGNNNLPEITIRPDVSGKLVAIAYLKTPTKVSVIGDSVEFPASMFNLIVDMALNFVSVKEGDGASLLQVSDAMVNKLVSLMK
jgi:hypothetical protein